jgi:uncharacterized repeat protein (TIGR01451 family)
MRPFFLSGLAVAVLCAASAQAANPPPAAPAFAPPFIANAGQLPDSVRYYLPTIAGTVYVDVGGDLIYARAGLTERWIGGEAQAEGGARSRTQVNFLAGDEDRWQRDVPAFDDLALGEVWPGVGVKLIAGRKNVEKRFTVAPAAAIDAIRVRLDGASALRVAANGELVVKVPAGELRFSAPLAWQEGAEDSRRPVAVRYAVHENTYGFVAGDYDRSRPLVIDPLISTTFIGGTSGDVIVDIAIDPVFGQVFAAGTTADYSTFPVAATQPQPLPPAPVVPYPVFIAKFSANLSSLDVLTFFGSGGLDTVEAIAYDAIAQRLFITGAIDGAPGLPAPPVLPTPQNPVPHATRTGRADSYILSFSRDLSSVLAGSWLGGSGDGCGNGSRQDETHDIAVHPVTGDVYVTGETCSRDFPNTAGSELNPSALVTSRGFVSRFNGTLTSHLQSSYFVGDVEESPVAIAIHPVLRKIYIAGESESDTLPERQGGFQPTQPGVAGFVARFSEDLTDIEVSTYLGGSTFPGTAVQRIVDVIVGPEDVGGSAGSGDVFVLGLTSSTNFPGLGAGSAQTTIGGGIDAFIARLSSNLAVLDGATLFGGEGAESPLRMTQRLVQPATNGENDLYITGATNSCQLPATQLGAFPTCNLGGSAFVAAIDENLDRFERATYLGSDAGGETGRAILVGAFPNSEIYVAGSGARAGFPVGSNPGVFPTIRGAGDEAFLSRFDTSLGGSGPVNQTNLVVSLFESADPVNVGQDYTYTASVQVVGVNTLDASGVVLTINLDLDLGYRFAIPDAGGCGELNRVITCTLGTIPRGTGVLINIGVTALGPAGSVTVTANATANEPDADASDNTNISQSTTVNVANVSIVDSVAPTGDRMIPFGQVGLTIRRQEFLTITNTGTIPVQIGPTVGDPLTSVHFAVTNPGGCFGVILAAGISCRIDIEFTPQALGDLSDSFNLDFVGVSQAVISVSGTGAAASADLAVSMTVDDAALPVNDDAIFRVTVINNGPDVTDPVVTDTIPAGLALIPGMQPVPSVGIVLLNGSTLTWGGFSLARGEQATLDIPVVATANPPQPCQVNTVDAGIVATDPATDPVTANNSATVRVGLPACADLVLLGNDIVRLITGSLEHRVRVRNDGPTAATDVRVRLDRYVNVTSGRDETGGPAPAVVAMLAVGQEVAIVANTVSGNGRHEYDISVSATEQDPDTANNDTDGFYFINDGTIGTNVFSCFVATAAYGSYLEPEVVLLRRFRDRQLLSNAAGRAFVAWYYRVSPPIAEYIADHRWAQMATRATLTPIVYTIKYPAPAAFVWLALLLLPWRRRLVAGWREALAGASVHPG